MMAPGMLLFLHAPDFPDQGLIIETLFASKAKLTVIFEADDFESLLLKTHTGIQKVSQST